MPDGAQRSQWWATSGTDLLEDRNEPARFITIDGDRPPENLNGALDPGP